MSSIDSYIKKILKTFKSPDVELKIAGGFEIIECLKNTNSAFYSTTSLRMKMSNRKRNHSIVSSSNWRATHRQPLIS